MINLLPLISLIARAGMGMGTVMEKQKVMASLMQQLVKG
jgi:hypothetical protein